LRSASNTGRGWMRPRYRLPTPAGGWQSGAKNSGFKPSCRLGWCFAAVRTRSLGGCLLDDSGAWMPPSHRRCCVHRLCANPIGPPQNSAALAMARYTWLSSSAPTSQGQKPPFFFPIRAGSGSWAAVYGQARVGPSSDRPPKRCHATCL
jgi:hypothetical protein